MSSYTATGLLATSLKRVPGRASSCPTCSVAGSSWILKSTAWPTVPSASCWSSSSNSTQPLGVACSHIGSPNCRRGTTICATRSFSPPQEKSRTNGTSNGGATGAAALRAKRRAYQLPMPGMRLATRTSRSARVFSIALDTRSRERRISSSPWMKPTGAKSLPLPLLACPGVMLDTIERGPRLSICTSVSAR